MRDEVRTVEAFYDAPVGTDTGRLLGRHLLAAWPELVGQRLLGIGHAAPFLPLWDARTSLAVSARLGLSGVALGLHQRYGRECVVSETALPFPDLSFDRVLMIHALETSHAGGELLRAVWRVLRDDGKLLLVVPNRRGVWALSDTTPFGQGRPFSQRQLWRQLAQCMFHVERSGTALYPPPFPPLHRRKVGDLLERAGSAVLPTCGGVVIVEAVKDLWGGLPLTREGVRTQPTRQVVGAG